MTEEMKEAAQVETVKAEKVGKKSAAARQSDKRQAAARPIILLCFTFFASVSVSEVVLRQISDNIISLFSRFVNRTSAAGKKKCKAEKPFPTLHFLK